MIYTRRAFMGFSVGSAIALSAERLLGQGVAAHAAKPLARQAPSRRPFNAHFVDVGAAAGLHAVGWACGVSIGDYNNDGFEDIFCTYFGQNILYRNNGDGTFTDVTKAAGLLSDQARWGAGCSFLDYNRDGHLDLFVSNYLRFSFEHAPVPGANTNCNWKGIPVECGPLVLPTGRHPL